MLAESNVMRILLALGAVVAMGVGVAAARSVQSNCEAAEHHGAPTAVAYVCR